jgi:hypothetical protein
VKQQETLRPHNCSVKKYCYEERRFARQLKRVLEKGMDGPEEGPGKKKPAMPENMRV